MDKWLRFEHVGKAGFGKLEGNTVAVYQGDMFTHPVATSQTLALSAVRLLTPTQPTKMLAVWNNFHALAAKLNAAIPKEPLYLVKTSNSFLAGGETIRLPRSFNGKIVFEGELGVVIGKTCKGVSEAEAPAYIFGYTCINAGLDPATLTVKTVLNGQERQHYPVSDMIFPPARLVSLISQDMTLFPGDVICCGTSVGVGSMKPGSTIEITIEGIGTLANIFE